MFGYWFISRGSDRQERKAKTGQSRLKVSRDFSLGFHTLWREKQDRLQFSQRLCTNFEGDLDFWLFIFHSDTQTAIHIQWNPNNKRFKLLTADYYSWLGSCNNIMQKKKWILPQNSSLRCKVQRVHNGVECTQTDEPEGHTEVVHVCSGLSAQFMDKWDEEIKPWQQENILPPKSFVTELKVVEMSSFLSLPGKQKHLNVVSWLNPLIMK